MWSLEQQLSIFAFILRLGGFGGTVAVRVFVQLAEILLEAGPIFFGFLRLALPRSLAKAGARLLNPEPQSLN